MNVENVSAHAENKKKSELQINWDDWENNPTNYPNVAINEKVSDCKMSFIMKYLVVDTVSMIYIK